MVSFFQLVTLERVPLPKSFVHIFLIVRSVLSPDFFPLVETGSFSIISADQDPGRSVFRSFQLSGRSVFPVDVGSVLSVLHTLRYPPVVMITAN